MNIESNLVNRSGQILKVSYCESNPLENLDEQILQAVHGFCFHKDKMVIVYSEEKGYWAPPGGGIEKGETYEEALVREVAEETNMKVLHQKFIGYQDIVEPNQTVRQTRSMCVVEPFGEFISDSDGDVTEIKLIDPKDYKQYFDWGKIGERLMTQALEMKQTYENNTTTATDFIGKKVLVKMDRPLGARHEKFGWSYELNYGFIPNTLSPDGEELDAYVCGVDEPLETFEGKCVAVIRRTNDEDDKLIVVPEDKEGISDNEIIKATHFQERWFKSKILR